jgi:ribosomal protein S18 acetylase RimI-like enzyme
VTGTVIEPARAGDEGEILTVQRAAYVSEAQRYDDPHIPPLTEPLDSVAAAVAAGQVIVARSGARLVGAVRGVVDGSVCHVGRLVVAPDQQRRGIGSALLAAVEAAHAGTVGEFALFTGADSAANLRLYERFGYRVVWTEPVTADWGLVHLSKPAPGALVP